jgi:ABC-type antimicrobial peptide transport system permease subunit
VSSVRYVTLTSVAKKLETGGRSKLHISSSGVTALLLAVITIACLAPARRAAQFDPMAALRRE